MVERLLARVDLARALASVARALASGRGSDRAAFPHDLFMRVTDAPWKDWRAWHLALRRNSGLPAAEAK